MSNNTFMKRPFVQKCILGLIVVGFLTILAGTLINIKGTKQKKIPNQPMNSLNTVAPQREVTVMGIVKSIDNTAHVMTITDINTKMDSVYSFTGGTNVIGRYGKVLMVKNLCLGEIVKATYDSSSNKLVKCEITQEAWEYKEVSNWSLDKEKKTLYVGSNTFKYGELFEVFNSTERIDSNALSEKDVLTVKGINGQVYSVIVSKGHGTFQLANYKEFIGGTIEIGYDVMTKVEEDQVITLTEGDYRVTVKKGTLEAVKYIHVAANDMTTLNLGEYKKQPAKQGKVRFVISPEGADLYINNVETEYEADISLEYGQYTVKVSCAGYQTFTETLTVGTDAETLYIDLVDSALSKATPTPSTTATASVTSSPAATNSVTSTNAPMVTVGPTSSASATVSASPSTTATSSPGALATDSDHTITISGPSGAKVYINNEYKGMIPLTFTKIIGSNISCTLKKDGQSDKTYRLTVNDDNADVNWHFSQWW
ncbi:MAG: PEGA domain-containing protein [bacterium]|nr:PEGA domain-containing protein [bacterium]